MRDVLTGIVPMYLEHRFDLLGSGWISVNYGLTDENNKQHETYDRSDVLANLSDRITSNNLSEAKRIWHLIDVNYKPIDWQLDVKSKYRWSEKIWYKNIDYINSQGADVKLPWELARMQHLVHLAWAYALARDDNSQVSGIYINEFRHQILDFIATNPPRFGVNWVCAMDVAIRVANWLLAYDLFKGVGAEFDVEFMDIFYRSIYEHGYHIVNNLEWSEALRGNHYLSDIVGLLFVAVYLPSSSEVDGWLVFAVNELTQAVAEQFHEDGSNFEASTSYHRLSTELVLYATALILGLSDDKRETLKTTELIDVPVGDCLTTSKINFYQMDDGANVFFPDWYWQRLRNMGEFAVDIQCPDGRIPQIGDNDNGRLFKIIPSYQACGTKIAASIVNSVTAFTIYPLGQEVYWIENTLNHRHLVAAMGGVFAIGESNRTLETNIVSCLARHKKIRGQASWLEKKQLKTICS